MGNSFRTRALVELFPQKGGWVYVRVPLKMTRALLPNADRGLIPIVATVGTTSWNTSLLPLGDGTHFIALNAKVRKKEGIIVGKRITFSFVPR